MEVPLQPFPTEKEITKQVSLEETARSAAEVVVTRRIIWAVAASLPVILTVAAWGGNRIMNTLDTAVVTQNSQAGSIIRLEGAMQQLVKAEENDKADLNTKIDREIKILNDRQSAQAGWLQQLRVNVEELQKYVYLNLRVIR